MPKRFALLLATVLIGSLLAGPVAAANAQSQRVEDFGSVVAVKMDESFPIASLMRADCAFAHRVIRPDGSATETMSCRLSSSPVMIPAFQGVAPSRAVIYGGGACTWTSDFMWETIGEPVYADSFRVVVTPSGKVQARSTYPAQPLDCE
ncbi:hypothetical protein BH23CHL7_BH23CHL7_21670 [soil metagenome]